MLRLTTLTENSGIQGNFLAEWAWCILIETDQVNILLDTGKSISATYNADTLGIDLNKIDKIVLSHSHYDHTGGLRDMLRRIGKDEIEVIAHPHIWADRYNRREGKPDKFMGTPFPRPELENFGAVFNISTRPVRITDTIMTSGEVPMVTDFEKVSSTKIKRIIKQDNGEITDEILDDLAVFINTKQGLVIVTGCAHRGIINTLYHAQRTTGVERIYAVFGGAHLNESSEERIWQTIKVLKEMDIQKLGLCHCTGLPAISMMAHEFGDRFIFNNAGTVIDLDEEDMPGD
jgi:7,8-dihydropterin-6-yl-methyl-4-(beta-D-ribofuranosyl)aminobenzene 5'-phosphate synthase